MGVFFIISTSLIQHHVFSSIFHNIPCLRRTILGRINLIVDKQPDKSKFFSKHPKQLFLTSPQRQIVKCFPVCYSAKLLHNTFFLAFMSLTLLLFSRSRERKGFIFCWTKRKKKRRFYVQQFVLPLEIILDLQHFSLNVFYLYLYEIVNEGMEKTKKPQYTLPLQIHIDYQFKTFFP